MAEALFLELSWGVLSSIGIVCLLFGFLIIGITGWSAAASVPIISSVAGCLANALCYYAYYQTHPPVNTAVASAFADVMWMVQEASLSFYSYIILTRVLIRRSRRVFLILFWGILVLIISARLAILVMRVKVTILERDNLQSVINRAHIAYFVCIASIEILCSFFLLRKFASAKKVSREASLNSKFFRYLLQSTEVRMTTLAVIGTTRAVTYSFQPSMQESTNTVSQVDRFIYTFECLFPMMIYIDLLASRVKFTISQHERSVTIMRPLSTRSLANTRPLRKASVSSRHYLEGNASECELSPLSETTFAAGVASLHIVERPEKAKCT
ncbi:unnamed protein product [Clonostachys rosea f. rosea IK726]|uniref:Uncharacterized protein n=1 Tax=Clonostachys rosea f. rosea IK726 TaxID=1349383 RepID=A0ACA9U0Q3_BIOOC|nr:unnamed protein product [Clonostachys rosea f. rosea IK726]